MKQISLLFIAACCSFLSAQSEPIIVSLLEEDHNFGETEWEQEAFEEIEEQFERLEEYGLLYKEEALLNYLQRVLDRIKPDGLEAIPVQIFVLNNPDVNARMYMDGRLVLNTGMLSILSTEGELAFLLGHELAHLIFRHVIRMTRRIEESYRGSRYIRRNDRKDEDLAYYSQDFESFADSLGLELMRAGGYSQVHAYTMLNRLPKEHDEDPRLNFWGRLIGLRFGPPSHPSGASRLGFVEELFVEEEDLRADESLYLDATKLVRNKNLDVIYQSGRLDILPGIDSLIANLGEEGTDYANQLSLVRAEILLRSIDSQREMYYYYYATHSDEEQATFPRRKALQEIYDIIKPIAGAEIVAAGEALLNHPFFACKSNRLLGLYYHKTGDPERMKFYIETCLRLAEEQSIRLLDRRFLRSLLN